LIISDLGGCHPSIYARPHLHIAASASSDIAGRG
jgi:hypothetical protein